MLDTELQQLRDKYNSLIEEKERLIDLSNKIKELKKLPVIQEYLESTKEYKQIRSKDYTNDGLENQPNSYFVRNAFSHLDITPRNDYFVYMGTYRYTTEVDIEHGANDIEVSRNDKSADYVIYYNLEARTHSIDSSVIIPYSEADKFESTHKIIFPKNTLIKEKYFYDLQEEYYETAILESQEDAINKINKLVRKE